MNINVSPIDVVSVDMFDRCAGTRIALILKISNTYAFTENVDVDVNVDVRCPVLAILPHVIRLNIARYLHNQFIK